jgi:hypothetical protein
MKREKGQKINDLAYKNDEKSLSSLYPGMHVRMKVLNMLHKES